jgi:hypothetical protein
MPESGGGFVDGPMDAPVFRTDDFAQQNATGAERRLDGIEARTLRIAFRDGESHTELMRAASQDFRVRRHGPEERRHRASSCSAQRVLRGASERGLP